MIELPSTLQEDAVDNIAQAKTRIKRQISFPKAIERRHYGTLP